MVGGPWVSVTWDEPYAPAPGGTLPFGWHARASQERELRRDAEELKRITSACFQHYTTVFDPEYPYADYQQVFAPASTGARWSSPAAWSSATSTSPRARPAPSNGGMASGSPTRWRTCGSATSSP